MNRRRQRVWAIVVIAIIVLAAQFAFFQPVRDLSRKVISGPVSLVSSLTIRARENVNLLRSIRGLSKENADLKNQNTEQLSQIAQLRNIKNENEQLKKDLSFSESRPDLKLLPVSIVSYSPIGSFQAITIDVGANDGVVEGQVVISSGFLVGKVKNVSANTSEVWLLSNRNLLTPVILTNSQVTGILKGGIRGLVVDNVPVDTAVKKGELVVTSALEGLYPAGLAVGQIEEVISEKEEIFIEVRISSPVNIGNVRTLFLVK